MSLLTLFLIVIYAPLAVAVVFLVRWFAWKTYAPNAKPVAWITSGIVAWPIWYLIAHEFIYAAGCAFGDAGPRIHEYAQVRIVKFPYDSFGYEIPRNWPNGAPFLKPCGSACDSAIRDRGDFFFDYDFRELLEIGHPILDAEWSHGPTNAKRKSQVLMWIAPAGTAACISRWGTSGVAAGTEKCVAAREERQSERVYTVLKAPFAAATTASAPSGRSSTAWEWFGVKRNEYQLLLDRQIVARYSWYVKDLFPNNMFSNPSMCPSDVHAWNGGIKQFWRDVLSKDGVRRPR